MLRPYKSKYYLVVGEKHGCHVSSMGVKRYVNDIKRACDTLEEAELTVKQQNTPVHFPPWGSYEPEELYRITQEAYEHYNSE
jgi:hypothetical protein